uniref:Translocator protein n=1 Tax=Lygus hesperus TaxID=30085 RepID=A0A0K8TDL5_LYGHE
MLTKHTLLLAVLVLLPNIGGWLGAFTFDLDWYNKLHKAPINPPGWVFGPMWTVLYCLMGVASFLVIMKDGSNAFAPFLIYLIQLGLNWAWTPIFFHYHLLLWSLIEISITDVLVVLTIVVFWRVRPLAAVLLLPYIAWLGIATYLTTYIYLNN